MELLEPTQLTIHIPHDLQIQVHGSIYTLKGISGDKAILKGWFRPRVPIKHVVPLVRPLTYLLKEIIHDGLKFTPYNLLSKYNQIGYHFNVDRGQLAEIIAAGQLDMGKMPYWMVTMCASWHFDVNNLLTKKLANHLI